MADIKLLQGKIS